MKRKLFVSTIAVGLAVWNVGCLGGPEDSMSASHLATKGSSGNYGSGSHSHDHSKDTADCPMGQRMQDTCSMHKGGGMTDGHMGGGMMGGDHMKGHFMDSCKMH
jgi:hypothetical protein